MLYAGIEKFNILKCAMFSLKYCVLVIVVFLNRGFSVSVKSQNETAEILWKLSNFALQSRQNLGNHPYPYSYKYPGKYPQYYQNYPVKGQYPGSNYPISYHEKPYPHKYHTYNDPLRTIYNHQPFRQNSAVPKESFMDILFTIARNDDLQCVPKIICEVTSGTISGRQQSLNLPLNINMESLLGFVSTLSGVQSSPLLYFGKAALQGYAAKGNTGSCNYAYPECPSDPDKLVQYLNNHNGGFFRYFNGASRTQNAQVPSNFRWRNGVAEERIQNNPTGYAPNNFRDQKGIIFPATDQEELYPNYQSAISLNDLKFPNQEDGIFNNEVQTNENDFLPFHSQTTLKFPTEDHYRNYPEQPFRKPKELPYDISYYHHNNDLVLQKPLPNHKASPMIFPVRTGTGDLRLDAEELGNNKNPFYEDDDIKISFNGFNNGKYENYYATNDYERNIKKVTFPSR